MVTRSCPNCGNAIDPLLAPALRVTAGKVVTYCSSRCADGASVSAAASASAPASAPVRPAPAPAPPPEPVLSLSPAASAAPPKRRWPRIVAAIGLVALGVALAVALGAGPRGNTSSAQPTPSTTPGANPATTPAPLAVTGPLTPAAALDAATSTLRAGLTDTSSRVRALSAGALLRLGDAPSQKVLEDALATDPSEIRRLEIAFALARANVPAGFDHLVSNLSASRRDLRLEAARSLARLGDTRGQRQLESALGLTNHKLAAAESLASLGQDKAFELLKDQLSSGSAEIKLRAAVALGKAGDKSGLELLRAQAGETRVELGAALALAKLNDPLARPALERALGLTALRVDAAIALRGLGVVPDLAPLTGSLASADELGRITSAEALVVLLAPNPPAELGVKKPEPK